MRDYEVIPTLNDIARSVMQAAENTNLETVLQRIAQVSRELVGARYAALSVPNPNREGLQFFRVAGLNQDEIDKIAHHPRGIGLLGYIATERVTLRLSRMSDHPSSVGFPEGHPLMTSFLGVPIQIGDSYFGNLYLCDREDGQPFTEEDEWLIQALAGYAALAIAGVRLGEQQSRTALLEERERISMDLHDGVIQSLYGLGMQLEQLSRREDMDDDDIAPYIEGLNNIIDEIRGYIHELKQRNREQRTIHDALSMLIDRLGQPESIQIELEAPHILPSFPGPIFDAMLQMVNEALSNAFRHANASRISIHVSQSESMFTVRVADNGKGFDPKQPQNGLGLANLHKRAEQLQGHVTLESSPDDGTHVSIHLPLTRY